MTPEEVCVLLSLWLLHHSWSRLVLCLSLLHVHITLVITFFTFPTIILMLPWPLCERWLAANIALHVVPYKVAPVTAAGSQLRRQYLLKKLSFPRSWLRAWSADTQSLNDMFIATFRGFHTTRFHTLQRQSTAKLHTLLVPMQSAGEESCDAWPPPACARVTLLAKEWLTEERKLFVPASAKLVHHARSNQSKEFLIFHRTPMEETTVTPMHTQQRHLWDSNPVGQSPSA